MRNAKKQGLFILTGICFIVAALVMRLFPYLSRPLDSTEKSIYDEQVPVIWVACNKPNQQVYVTIITDMEGRTDLSFQLLESDMDDVKVWIIINDDYAPFTWSTMKRAAAVQMYTLDQKEFFSEPNDLVYGTGHHAGFRLDFGENADRMHTIRIEPEDYIMKNREDCLLRVPRIGPWYNRNATKDSIVNLPHDDPEWIGKTMDGEELYFLDMQFGAVVHNPAAKDSDLVLKLESPKCKESDSCFDWALSEVFVTQIHYTDEKWQRDMELGEMFRRDWTTTKTGLTHGENDKVTCFRVTVDDDDVVEKITIQMDEKQAVCRYGDILEVATPVVATLTTRYYDIYTMDSIINHLEEIVEEYQMDDDDIAAFVRHTFSAGSIDGVELSPAFSKIYGRYKSEKYYYDNQRYELRKKAPVYGEEYMQYITWDNEGLRFMPTIEYRERRSVASQTTEFLLLSLGSFLLPIPCGNIYSTIMKRR